MNIYFLVEGRRTEKIVYPKWLSHLIPELKQIHDPFRVTVNSYYLFSGNGFPSLLDNHLSNAIADVNSINKYNYLVVCLDCDEVSVKDRQKEIFLFLKKRNLKLNKAQLVIIAQNKCIETWFLGNRKAYSMQSQSVELRRYTRFYNVKTDDPELMTKMPNFNSPGQFHEAYLSEMLLEKNIRYTKRNPRGVIEKHYLTELVRRVNATDHLLSFKNFLNLCSSIRKSILGAANSHNK